MKIVHDFPPNYQEIIKALPAVANNKRLLLTYGDIVYYPYGKGSIPEHLKVHERTHTKQQGSSPQLWWNKYLTSPKFRLSEEIQAYRRQYAFFKSTNHNIGEQRNFLSRLAADLCSPLYGEPLGFAEARKEIANEV